MGVKAHILIGG